jgi:hypothetical protein
MIIRVLIIVATDIFYGKSNPRQLRGRRSARPVMVGSGALAKMDLRERESDSMAGGGGGGGDRW